MTHHPGSFSDDELDSLVSEIGRINAALDRMTRVNRALASGDDDSLHTLGLPRPLIAQLKLRHQQQGAGYPDYSLNNNRELLLALQEQVNTARSATRPASRKPYIKAEPIPARPIRIAQTS